MGILIMHEYILLLIFIAIDECNKLLAGREKFIEIS